MLAEAVSRVSRVADVAADAARDAANAVSSRAQDFVRNLAGSGASADRTPPPPANDDGSSASAPAQGGQDTRSIEVNRNNPTESPPGIRETGDAANTLLNPADEIDKLNSDGDRVVMSMTGEGKLQIPAGRLPVGIGAKGQYGYDITVTQVGDAAQGGRPPTYDVTFDKNLQGGGVLEPVVKKIDPAVELNLSATNSVTMSFDSKADAARAVGILQRAAIEQSIRDAGQAAMPGPSDPTDNPVVDDSGSGVPTLPTPADPIADRFAPSEADMAFLRDNITSYTTTVGLQERGKIAVKMANLGIETRFDGNQELSRTVTLPHDGQPGRLTYTIAGDLQASTKEKLTIGKQKFDELEIGYVPQNIVDHGRLRGEISLSWDLPPGATDRTISGQPVPEATSLSGGEGLGAPDEVSARLQLEHQTLASLVELNRTDMRRISIEATTRNPGAHAGPVVNSLLQGDLEGAFRGMGNDFSVTAQSEFVERHGVHQQHEVGVEFADVFEVKGSLIGNVGRDDVIGRRTSTFTGTEIADRMGGPQQPAPADPTRPPQEQRPEQLVVVPNDGLNVRPKPSTDADRTSVLQHGTFVQPTGREQTDTQGNQWIEVRGPDVNDRPVQGWVAAEHVRPHPAGAMDGSGRINPDLEAQGYRAHTVRPGDNIWDLARRDGANFGEMVQLNGDHLINPGLVFPGDKVYIPGTGRAEPPARPPAELPQPRPVEPPRSSPSTPSDTRPGQSPSGAPSGDPSNSPSGGVPSEAPSGSGSPSGNDAPSRVPSDRTPSGEAPTQQPQPGVPGRTDLDRVLRNYQMPDDPDGPQIWWEPGAPLSWVTDPQKVTPTEARMLDQLSPFELRDMKNIKEGASSTADERFPAPQDQRANFPAGAQGDRDFRSWANNDGHRDAFRHAYWNALLTQRFGADFAERFTNAHEGVPGNEADREAMDLYNNEVGRRIAQDNPNASEQELANLVQKALDNGDLIVIDRAGNLAWSDQVRYGQHGVGNDSAVPGVLQPVQPNGPTTS